VFRLDTLWRREASTMRITRILVPIDFSAHSEAAMRYAQELARPFHAAIHLVTVVEDPLAAGVWSSEIYTVEIAELQINLVRDAEKRLRGLVPAGVDSMTTEVRTGPAAKQILDAARERRSDLIVMGTHGRTGIAHVVMGSVAEKVVRLAPCPVLTLHAARSEPSAASVA
jgi:nucleotide-binding universal stress UspA family protein